jgi:hypothetical protein
MFVDFDTRILRGAPTSRRAVAGLATAFATTFGSEVGLAPAFDTEVGLATAFNFGVSPVSKGLRRHFMVRSPSICCKKEAAAAEFGKINPLIFINSIPATTSV